MKTTGMVVLSLLAAAAAACSNADTDCKYNACGDASSTGGGGAGSGGSGGEGGQGGSGGGTPAECVPSLASEDAVASECGVFVSSTLGADGNDGSRTKPFATIKKALAVAGSKPVYVCAESTPYDEDVLIESAVDLYGGLDCQHGWVYDAARSTRIATAAGLIPMRVKGVAGAVRIEDFDLTAANAVEAGGSSVGMFVASSGDVMLRRVNITAGKAKDGVDAVLDGFAFPTPAELSGVDANGTMGGKMRMPVACPGGDETRGGDGGDDMVGGMAGKDGAPDYGDGGGKGGAVNACNPSAAKGSDGPDDQQPGPGAAVLGTLDADGWTPEAGTAGPHGKAGQGGGGGASDDNDGMGPGGSGAAGGCGGAGGPGGGGGGASIALLVLSSTVNADGGVFTAKAAGAGGAGIAGEPGQGADGVPGNPAGGGCQGGEGGDGAAGLPGGGGAGGVSAAVVSQGKAPVVSGTERLFDATKQPGGVGAGAGNNGVDGKSQATLEVGG